MNNNKKLKFLGDLLFTTDGKKIRKIFVWKKL